MVNGTRKPIEEFEVLANVETFPSFPFGLLIDWISNFLQERTTESVALDAPFIPPFL